MGFGWISFTTDYGTSDGFVAACHGVIARIAPSARVIDVSHAVPPQDVRRGAVLLAQTIDYLPVGVHVAVVDPGVGTARRGVALDTGDSVLVGPDNGLLLPAAEVIGGVIRAVELTSAEYRLPATSATFHGRDVFAPAAAHLARGVRLEALGGVVDPAGLVRLPQPKTVVRQGELRTEILGTDHFGNIQLAASAEDLAALATEPGTSVDVHAGEHCHPARLGRTFADVAGGAMVVYPDSAGLAAIAVNGGSALAMLGDAAVPGREVCLRCSAGSAG